MVFSASVQVLLRGQLCAPVARWRVPSFAKRAVDGSVTDSARVCIGSVDCAAQMSRYVLNTCSNGINGLRSSAVIACVMC